MTVSKALSLQEAKLNCVKKGKNCFGVKGLITGLKPAFAEPALIGRGVRGIPGLGRGAGREQCGDEEGCDESL